MSVEVVREGGHKCSLPAVFGCAHGTVVRCRSCGREWKAVHPGNPEWSRWRRPLIGRRFFWLRRRGDGLKESEGVVTVRFP